MYREIGLFSDSIGLFSTYLLTKDYLFTPKRVSESSFKDIGLFPIQINIYIYMYLEM